MIKKNLFWLTVILMAGLSLQCTHKQKREPASSKALITENETQALAEILGGDSPLHSYRHPMKVNFYTNGDQAYLAKTARKALQQALIETLGNEASEQALAKLMVSNLKSALLENFVKTLRVYKIVNTGLQVDLSFIPEPYDRHGYAPEFNSNQLVRLSETGKLSSQWERLEKATVTSSLYNNSTLIPAQSGQADYIGGVMTFYVEILDLKPSILLPMKNGVKGFIRYRRYYRMNQGLASSMNCEGFTVSTKSAGPGVPLFYTVDLYKNFNLKNLLPTEETVEVFPGLLATSSEGRYELMPDHFDKAGRSITTATVTVEKKKNIANALGFSLHRLVYNLKRKSLDTERSVVSTVYYHSSGENADSMKDMDMANARRGFLRKCGSSLESLLQLDKVLPGDM